MNPLDPKFSINWPLAISEMSEKDRSATFLLEDFSGYGIANM